MAHLHINPTDLHRAKIEYRPGYPHSRIYDYTYGYSMNYYQPMIDYLDKRDSSENSANENLQLPHLPWTNERYIKEYDPKNPIKVYDSDKVNEIAKKSQKAALKNINNFSVKHSYFSAIPTADATKLLKNLPKQSALEKVYRKDVKQIIEDIKDLEMDAYYRYKEGERQLLESDRENMSVELKRAIKGKSANQIRNILLAESMKNIHEKSDKDAQPFMQCYKNIQKKKAVRSLSETRPSRFEQFNDGPQISTALENVKKELSSFTNKTEDFLNDTRYRLQLINCTLREQENLFKKL